MISQKSTPAFRDGSNNRPPAVAEVGDVWRSKNAAFQERLMHLLRYARHGGVPILLEGASGTGKSSIARAIHAASPREKKPFKAVTLSSMEDSLAGSDLFGHVVGAFTDARQTRVGAFISASGGTLFLDEIGKASDRVQLKLLGCVEEKVVVPEGSDREIRVDVRIVSATNIPLDVLVRNGTLLPDLAARLGLFRVVLSSLSERTEDIVDIARKIVTRRARDFGYERAPSIDDDLADALVMADWPMNIRQLDAVMQHLLMEAAISQSSVLTCEHCVGDLCNLGGRFARLAPHDGPTLDVRGAIQSVESRAALAKRLGISESTLYRRLRQQESDG